MLKKSIFFENISKTPMGSPSIFLNFTTMVVKTSQRAPFYSFRHCEQFQNEYFCLKIRFSEAQHYIRFFFKRPAFFLCYFFLICFHRSPPQFLLKMKRFASIKDSSRFSALCDDLPETFFKKIFDFRFFPLFFCFFFSIFL